MSDEEVLRASQNNPDLFAVLLERYEAPFMRKALYMLRSTEDAEDVVQEAFTKIYIYAEKYREVEQGSFRAWAYKILVNTALTHYGKMQKKRERSMELTPEVFEMLPDSRNQFAELELREYVLSVFSKLPEHFSSVLTEHVLLRRPQEELALEEGTSVGAIKTRVHRAKLAFREAAQALE